MAEGENESDRFYIYMPEGGKTGVCREEDS